MSKLTLKKARELTGHATGLGKPSKMPGFSTSLPASACKLGARLALVPGSTCHNCYAKKGHYRYPDVKKGLARRLAALDNPDWIAGMVKLIGHATAKSGVPYFRVHDSGDIQSTAHLLRWFKVARALPDVRFWIPTRERAMVRQAIADEDCPDNLTIRLSAAMIDKPCKPIADAVTSTVHDKESAQGFICPAPQQNGECGDCRACWDKTIPNTSYHVH